MQNRFTWPRAERPHDSLPESKVLSLRKSVGSSTFQMSGLSAQSIVCCLEHEWDHFLDRVRLMHKKDEFEARIEREHDGVSVSCRNGHGESGLLYFYRGICEVLEARTMKEKEGYGTEEKETKLSQATLDKCLMLWKEAVSMDHASRVFRLFSGLAREHGGSYLEQIALCPGTREEKVQRPDFIGKVLLARDDTLARVSEAMCSALLRSKDRLEIGKTIGVKKNGSLMAFLGASLVIEALQACPKAMEQADAFMVVDDDPDKLNDLISWMIAVQGNGTLRKPFFTVKKLAGLHMLKADYDVVFVSLFSSVPLSLGLSTFETVRQCAHEVLFLECCQEPVLPLSPAFLATPRRFCRLVDLMESTLKAVERENIAHVDRHFKAYEVQDRSRILPWFLHKFGLVHSYEFEQNQAHWRETFNKAGFDPTSVEEFVHIGAPISVFGFVARCFEEDSFGETSDASTASSLSSHSLQAPAERPVQ